MIGALHRRRGGSSGREGHVDAGNATAIAWATATTAVPAPAKARLYSSPPPYDGDDSECDVRSREARR